MMIVIVDYGVGNVGSVQNMLRKVGAAACISGDADVLATAGKLILPGVGNFGYGMEKLAQTGLIPVLNEHARVMRKPVLGICLGMQMMTRGSEESRTPGLGWIDAFTHRFKIAPGVRVPHMGWNAVRPRGKATLFANTVEESERFYFVHSYFVCPVKNEHVAATCSYGSDFAAAFEVDNLFGVQFHPEKSHAFGMELFRRFVAI